MHNSGVLPLSKKNWKRTSIVSSPSGSGELYLPQLLRKSKREKVLAEGIENLWFLNGLSSTLRIDRGANAIFLDFLRVLKFILSSFRSSGKQVDQPVRFIANCAI